jgi:hypothetical protein
MRGEDLEKNIEADGDKGIEVRSPASSRDSHDLIENTLPTEAPSREKHGPPIISTTTTINPPPNGGLTAWLQVAGSFFLFFNTWVRDISFYAICALRLISISSLF